MIDVALGAAIVAVHGREPNVLALEARGERLDALPHGTFHPGHDRTLELAVRRWVAESAGVELGYVEQLYTFGDRARDPREISGGPRAISIAYLALVRASTMPAVEGAAWRRWYEYFPWEDWRAGTPSGLPASIGQLRAWADQGDEAVRERRHERIAWCFAGGAGSRWNPELVLERYELLYEAELVAEAFRDCERPVPSSLPHGRPMAFDHRRMLATAIGRLRGKIAYRPVVFELLGPTFTLFELQGSVEALAGRRLHTANFRRLVDAAGLVERTGALRRSQRGRPAEEYRFRREVVLERPASGFRLGR